MPGPALPSTDDDSAAGLPRDIACAGLAMHQPTPTSGVGLAVYLLLYGVFFLASLDGVGKNRFCAGDRGACCAGDVPGAGTARGGVCDSTLLDADDGCE